MAVAATKSYVVVQRIRVPDRNEFPISFSNYRSSENGTKFFVLVPSPLVKARTSQTAPEAENLRLRVRLIALMLGRDETLENRISNNPRIVTILSIFNALMAYGNVRASLLCRLLAFIHLYQRTRRSQTRAVLLSTMSTLHRKAKYVRVSERPKTYLA